MLSSYEYVFILGPVSEHGILKRWNIKEAV
jgi:hypothetical protein